MRISSFHTVSLLTCIVVAVCIPLVSACFSSTNPSVGSRVGKVARCSSSCLNGGTCSRPGHCSCRSGYTGSRCQTPVCSPVCQNRGTCSSPGRCSCTSVYIGSRCETPVCSPVCQNRGTCSSPGRCSCISGYIGSRCETPPLNADDWDAHELVCGTNSDRFRFRRIVLGDDVDSVHTWPWLGRLTINKGSEGTFICSAEIVAKRFVITAAHCVTMSNGDLVKPGGLTLKFDTTKRNEGGVEVKVEIIFRHHDYQPASLSNDIAILKLFDYDSLVYGSSCRPVCLPVPNQDYFDFTNCWAAGWGKTETGNGADTLQELEMNLIPLTECNIRRVNVGWGQLDDSQLCAEDTDGMGGHTWGGDSGGPLMCKHDSQTSDWILIGISSFGSRGVRPDGFARVAKYSQWISDCFNEYGGPGPF